MDSHYYTVTAGRLRAGHEAELCCALARFAHELEWNYALINVSLHVAVWCSTVFDKPPNSAAQRAWSRCVETSQAVNELHTAEAENEVIRGVLIRYPHDPSSPWAILWNHAAAGAYVGYLGFELVNAEFYIESAKGELDPMQPMEISPEWIKDKFQGPPTVVSGWIEHNLRLCVPCARSDVKHAKGCLRLLEQHGTGVVVDH